MCELHVFFYDTQFSNILNSPSPIPTKFDYLSKHAIHPQAFKPGDEWHPGAKPRSFICKQIFSISA